METLIVIPTVTHSVNRTKVMVKDNPAHVAPGQIIIGFVYVVLHHYKSTRDAHNTRYQWPPSPRHKNSR